ncbi:DUF721 domain-containing protein [Cylindrospermum sp. FACHB-282]|uniref:DUF721 domain-containing protein n=1 Tax=Cylindrospermum sp. FACHB-282 TaxID=2692794 RepID=UPI0016847745|nr:DciA family protein [Cylindrospermum sp. FACHB-282]MBD2388720.1 DUF721 domain-containing protein [Cylindrospermum sp. FACHB-282]
MSFKSVNDILGGLQQQAKWQEPPLQGLLKCWAEVVGVVVAAHSRPVSIQRDVLSVATSSAAWAQNLTFGRQQLLLKINQKLPTPLVDIRFSSANWRLPPEEQKPEQTVLPHEHPSYLGDEIFSVPNVTPTLKNVNAAFGDWARAMQMRSHHLPLCPQCQCPTPPGELQRWSVCSLCSTKRVPNNS